MPVLDSLYAPGILWGRRQSILRILKEVFMPEAKSYPYDTRLNLHYQPLEVVDEKALADACTHKWYNQTLCKVNESVVRLGVIEGEYHWHKHDDDDEFFYVVEGTLYIDLEDRTVELSPETRVRGSQGCDALYACAAKDRDSHV
jgi:hypothetical protein